MAGHAVPTQKHDFHARCPHYGRKAEPQASESPNRRSPASPISPAWNGIMTGAELLLVTGTGFPRCYPGDTKKRARNRARG